MQEEKNYTEPVNKQSHLGYVYTSTVYIKI